MNNLNYNERAWAIDLISAINDYSSTRRRPIVRAGGEMTLTGKRNLFPDVLLYGDQESVRVRHGWELKMPDTIISDLEFIKNAKEKAERLHVNSFLLWNVNEAALYIKDENDFSIKKRWGPIGVTTRAEVKSQEEKWKRLLNEILSELNDFFENGILRSSSVTHIFDETFLVKIIQEFNGVTAQSIRRKMQSSSALAAHIKNWWNLSAGEYGKETTDTIDLSIAANIALTNWINRILFCHYLKKIHSAAKQIENINSETNLEEAKNIFNEITNKCDFLQVFKSEKIGDHIGEESWRALCELNVFLTNLNLETIPQEMLHKIVETLLQATRRKAAGQFSTPTALAKLLVAVSIEEREATVLDPCCGTGTIARAVYDLKRKHANQSIKDALKTTWASDKFQFPLQLCTISLADPAALGEIIQVFQADALELDAEREITFTDPSGKGEIKRALPRFSTVVSNLPFVRFEDLKKANPQIMELIGESNLSGKSDLFAHIIYRLDQLLTENGRIGVIISNSWIGSDWGEKFRKKIQEKYHIRTIVTSAAGRWFDNADVVTNILVLELKASAGDKTSFVTTKLPLNQWTDESIDSMSADILVNSESVETKNLRVSTYTQSEIEFLNKITVGWSSFFTDIRWLSEIHTKLILASSKFTIRRGMRKGWNKMFYPKEGHGIEKEYIQPVLRTIKNTTSYIAKADCYAFCCSESIENLVQKEKKGALAWIEKFESEVNGKGVLLPIALGKGSLKWYEMKTDTQADFAMSMNPQDRLFIARMEERGFVDQRIIGLTKKSNDIDLDLAHALLNSVLGLFFIEAAGFGRGLGALDLNPTKLNKGFLMWNLEAITAEQSATIKELFAKLCTRPVMKLEKEIEQDDRKRFDRAVFSAFGMEHLLVNVQKSLIELYHMRVSVKKAD